MYLSRKKSWIHPVYSEIFLTNGITRCVNLIKRFLKNREQHRMVNFTKSAMNYNQMINFHVFHLNQIPKIQKINIGEQFAQFPNLFCCTQNETYFSRYLAIRYSAGSSRVMP